MHNTRYEKYIKYEKYNFWFGEKMNYKTMILMLEEIKVMFPEDYKKIIKGLELNERSN